MTDDLISRADAIAEFNCCEYTPDGGIDANYAIDFLEQMPSADRPQGEWIPCSERLPNEGETVLVCMGLTGHKHEWEEQRIIEFGRISSDRYDVEGTGWEWLNESGADYWQADWNNSILAWMPLPKPWKGADDYERAIEQTEHDMLYEPTYNSEDGSM